MIPHTEPTNVRVRFPRPMTRVLVILASVALGFAPTIRRLSGAAPASKPRDYQFDGAISREVLENYLSRSISMEGLLNGRGDLDDNIRMLKETGAKFIGRACASGGARAN